MATQLEKCKRCKFKNRPKHTYPCTKCIDENMPCAPLTCEDCEGAWGYCSKRGKHERRMRPCSDFKWS